MKLILVSFFILMTFPVFTQINTPLLKPIDHKQVKLKKEITELASRINISWLTILDSRDDTTNIGYTPYNESVGIYEFKPSLQTELTTWFSNYLRINEQNKTETTLLVNIKKLRLSNEISPIIFENGHAGQPKNGWEKGIITKIEYFLQKDSFFIPLYRFDSIISLKGNLYRNADDLISMALKLSLDKLSTFNLDAVLSSNKKISINDIIRVNNQKYNFPIYTCSEYKKGVYKNFDEFKMNTPSLVDFDFMKGELGDILNIKEDNKIYVARDVWGFCDGKNLYINSSDKYSKLVRTGYSFYFIGMKALRKRAFIDPLKMTGLGFVNNTNERITKYDLNKQYYQVDMETGEVY